MAAKKTMYLLKEPVAGEVDPQTQEQKTKWVTVGRMFRHAGEQGEEESFNILLDKEVPIKGDHLYAYRIPEKKVKKASENAREA